MVSQPSYLYNGNSYFELAPIIAKPKDSTTKPYAYFVGCIGAIIHRFLTYQMLLWYVKYGLMQKEMQLTLLKHWSYISFASNHPFVIIWWIMTELPKPTFLLDLNCVRCFISVMDLSPVSSPVGQQDGLTSPLNTGRCCFTQTEAKHNIRRSIP